MRRCDRSHFCLVLLGTQRVLGLLARDLAAVTFPLHPIALSE